MANNYTSATTLVTGVVGDKNDTIIQAVDDDGSSSSSSSDSDSEGMERVPLTSSSHHTRTSSSSSHPAAAVDHHKPPMMVLAQLLSLTMGMLVARASFAVMKTTDSAILGHVSTAALEASSVSDMYTGCTGVLAQGGVLGTFVSQAMGASNPKLAGAWLQVALVVTLSLSVPVAMLWTVTGPATRGLFGASNHIANMASYYAIVLATALPGRAAFTAVAQYFGAQRIVKPVSEAGIVGASLNLLVGLPVVLAPLHLGFAACPWVTSLVTYVQLAYLLYTAVHRQKLHATSWPGWDVRAHVTRERMFEFLKLFVPASLSLASDFWRVAVIGIFASKLGAVEVAVFNTSYRLLWLSLIFIGCLASAASILAGQAVGAADQHTFHRVLKVSAAFAISILAVAGALLVSMPDTIARIFTNDADVLALFRASRFSLAAFLIFMNGSVFLESIAGALALQRKTFVAGLIGSWAGQVPGAALAVFCFERSLPSLYAGAACGYILLCVLLAGIIYRAEWDAVVADAQRRSETKTTMELGSGGGDDGDDDGGGVNEL